jgi:ribosome recycling factor
MSTIKEITEEADHKMQQSLAAVQREMNHLRAGRASTQLVEHIKVSAYGDEVPLQQLANLSTPDATTISITPYDKSVVTAIDKALRLSELGLTPQNDGTGTLRLTLPPPTEERRRELLKFVSKHGEEGKVALRNVRRDANDHIKKLQKDKAIGEDEMRTALEKIDKVLERHLAEVDQMLKAKEKEILEI